MSGAFLILFDLYGQTPTPAVIRHDQDECRAQIFIQCNICVPIIKQIFFYIRIGWVKLLFF